ncbi:MAG: hypothetical protein AWU59_2457 [Methanolobus sp. T82-4]|nr:MAG: hypothetical protein AWU59_2457 [Methanolobus sp. T82-4]
MQIESTPALPLESISPSIYYTHDNDGCNIWPEAFLKQRQSKGLKAISALRGFARWRHERAAITQLVECLAVNQNVTGSSPVCGAQNFLFSMGL